MIQIPATATFDSIVRALTDKECADLAKGRLVFKPCFDLAGFDDEPKPLAKTKPRSAEVDMVALKAEVLLVLGIHPNLRTVEMRKHLEEKGSKTAVEFFDEMEFGLEKLPPQTGRLFMMREVMEHESDEICKELAITANNLWVILYRARMALRACLEQHWFADGGRRPRAA